MLMILIFTKLFRKSLDNDWQSITSHSLWNDFVPPVGINNARSTSLEVSIGSEFTFLIRQKEILFFIQTQQAQWQRKMERIIKKIFARTLFLALDYQMCRSVWHFNTASVLKRFISRKDGRHGYDATWSFKYDNCNCLWIRW